MNTQCPRTRSESLSTIAYCKNSCDGVWYTYDDQRVSVTSLWPTEKGMPSGRYEQHLCTEHAYILFYQRRSMSMSAWAQRARQETKMRFKRQLDWLSALDRFCNAPEQPIAPAEYPPVTPPARTLSAHTVLSFAFLWGSYEYTVGDLFTVRRVLVRYSTRMFNYRTFYSRDCLLISCVHLR